VILLSLCLPFYTNSGMLAEQYRMWASYPPEITAQIEIVIVDDCSPDAAIDVPRPEGLPRLRIYRVLEDRPWHQHGARNLAADRAEGQWLLMTDMDHVVPAASLSLLLSYVRDAHPQDVFTFHRLDAPDLRPKRNERGELHPHVNTFALTREYYWTIGGYDERWCGFYGTDGYFRKRLFAYAPPRHLEDVPIVRYAREVIPDASTRADREAGRRRAERGPIMEAVQTDRRPAVLQFPWEQAL